MSISPMEKLLLTEQPQISQSEASQISTEASLHQFPLMARVSTLGTAVAPCLLESSTVHGEALIWLFPWKSVTWPEHVKKRAAERQTLIQLVVSSHGLDPHHERNPYGPTSFPTKPIIQVAGPIHTLIGHRPRSEFLKSFANPSSVMSRCLTYENGSDPLVRTVSTLPIDFGLQSIQILLSKSSRESSEEHSTLKIFLTSTMSSLQWMAMDSIERPQAEVANSLSLRLSRNKRIFEKRTISEEEIRQEARSTEEDWKKTQVDSKKILAQPHQSTTSNPSRQGADPEFNSTSDREVRARNCKPVSFIKGSDQPATTTTTTTGLPQQPATIAEDIISLAKSCRTLSFRFISRSDWIVDDLAKTASRSMTTGLLLPCNLLAF